jgi:hypothetical protein
MASETFSYTGSEQTWTVPSDVTEVTAKCYGAGGDTGGSSNVPGTGGYGEKTFDVSPGETLYIYVGGAASGNSGGWNGGGDGSSTSNENGGGGGGGSDVRQGGNTLSDRVTIAAGGGGAGGVYDNTYGDGGDGGGDSGQNGEIGDSSSSNAGEGGGGGTQSSGGPAGADDDGTVNATSGSLGSGGTGSSQDGRGGAGGGGGYYGGGGGGAGTNGGGGGGGGSSLGTTTTVGGGYDGNGEVVIEYTQDPNSPNNVSQTVNADDSITVSWDADLNAGTPDHYDIQISRDGSNYQSPSGGPSQVEHDGSTSYSATYNPNSDNSYQSQVGIDSSFRFRVRAENSASASAWEYTTRKNTTPIPPHNPTASRPDGTTVDLSWSNQSDVEDGTEVQYREDTGSGYGAWTTQTTTTAGSTTYSYAASADARYQFRLRTVAPDGKTSEWVYADYGNAGNVFFEDDFEDQNLTDWTTTSLADSQSGIQSGGQGDLGISGAAQGTYYVRLDGGDSITKNLGDLSGESDVLVKCYAATGSMDTNSEHTKIEWYDGAAWQNLRAFYWEYNRQGWVETTLVVPASYLSTDNRVRFRGHGAGGDHFAVDRVVVSDVADEYTTPADPSRLSLDASVEDEITASWTNNDAFGYPTTWRNNTLDGSRNNGTEHSSGTTSRTDGGLRDGERYEFQVEARVKQYRHGAVSQRFSSTGSLAAQATTILPAPTDLTVDLVGADSADVSWVDNHDYGDVRLEIKRSSSSTWSTDGTVSRNTEAYTYSSLLNGEEYDVRVYAQTEHTETRDQ